MAANLYQKSLSARPGYQPLADSPLVMDATVIVGKEDDADKAEQSRWIVGPDDATLAAITANSANFGAATTSAYDVLGMSRVLWNNGTPTVEGMSIALWGGDGGTKFELSQQRLLLLSRPVVADSYELGDYTLEANIRLSDETVEFLLADGYQHFVSFSELEAALSTLDPTRFYWIGYWARKPATAYQARQVGFHRAINSHNGNLGLYAFSGTINLPAVGQAMPAFTMAASYPCFLNVKFRCDDATVYRHNGYLLNGSDPAARMGFAPRRTDGPYAIRAFGTKASETGAAALTLTTHEYATSRAIQATNALILDHTANRRMTWGGAHNAFDPSESYDNYYDLCLLIDNALGQSKAMYANQTVGLAGGTGGNPDIGTICHEVKQAGLRGKVSGSLKVETLSWSGTRSNWRCNGFSIGRPPPIASGDSQLVDFLAALIERELGCPLWRGYVGGSQFTQATGSYVAGTTRYKGIPGVNDLCEMEGCLWLLAGYGINDINAGQTPAEYDAAVRQVLDDWRTEYGGVPKDAVLLGLPPVGAENANKAVLDAKVCQYNAVLRQAAIDYQIVFCNIYDLVQSDIEHCIEGGPSGIHYTAAGAAVVAAKLADDCEAGLATRVKFVGMSGDTQREMTAEWHPGTTVELRNVDLSKISAYVMPGQQVLVVGQAP